MPLRPSRVPTATFAILTSLALFAPRLGAQGHLFGAVEDAEPGAAFGTALQAVADLDGDGFADLIVGAPSSAANGAWSGRAEVFSGTDGTLILAASGHAAGDEYGRSVAAAGDLDLDGFVDLLVGALHDDDPWQPGYVDVLSGATGSVLLGLQGAYPNDHFGAAVASVGDVDGDGVPDIAVGAPFAAISAPLFTYGNVWLLSGKSGGALFLWWGSASGARFGAALAPAGDADGDGLPDLLVGSPGPTSAPGSARLLSTKSGAVLLDLLGDAAGDGFGSAVGAGGDVDLDGVPDLLVGAPGSDLGAPEAGLVRVFSATGGLLFERAGSETSATLGAAAAFAGDLDRDGVDDLVCGAPGSASQAGAVLALSGVGGHLLAEALGPSVGSRLGAAVGPIGDLDGDGFAEFLVGRPGGAGLAGALEIRRAAAAVPFASGSSPVESLVWSFVPAPAGQGPHGSLRIEGAAPLAPGLLLVGPDGAALPALGATLYVDPQSASFLPFAFGAAGEAVFPVDLGLASASGLELRLQGLAADATAPAGVRTSPGFLLAFLE